MTKIVHKIKMDLAEIVKATEIPLRTLRYVIDHQLVEGLRVERAGRGSARYLSLFDATVLACTAALLEAGVSASVVKEMINRYRGAKRSTSRESFWQGLENGRRFWHFGFSQVRMQLNVGCIRSLLEGVDYDD